MAANLPSPIGERGQHGYTLVELLVVLAIMALLIAATPALINSLRPGVEAKAAAHTLVDDLRGARAAAITANIPTSVIFDADNKTYDIEPYGVMHKLPRGVSLELLDARGENSGKHAEFRFFPDGSSNGGTIHIAAGNQRHWITDHWLTGRITFDE